MNEKEASALAKTVADECIAYRVRLLNRVITGIYDKVLQPFGITINQGSILTMLSLTERASSADIGRALLMEKSTVSRTLDRMKQNGWISVARQVDGPAQVVTVTPKGRKLMAASHGEWEKAQKEAAELLGDDGISAVRLLHGKLRSKKN
ncbi:MAG: winged helix-turn-helix transcriptional regulator [Nitrospirae bacterium]|nr:winged helix-turn-helix transcriptional regulator [Nitrospirota bacterium]